MKVHTPHAKFFEDITYQNRVLCHLPQSFSRNLLPMNINIKIIIIEYEYYQNHRCFQSILSYNL